MDFLDSGEAYPGRRSGIRGSYPHSLSCYKGTVFELVDRAVDFALFKINRHKIYWGIHEITYDTQVDVLRILFSDAAIEESDEEKPGIILDFDKIGNIVGMEILDASKRMENPRSVGYAVALPCRGLFDRTVQIVIKSDCQPRFPTG